MKVITTGCSFTDGSFDTGSRTWKWWLKQEFPEFEYVGLESLASPNCTNLPEITDAVRSLDSKEKAVAIIQLTGMDRVFVEGLGRSPTVASLEHHMKKKKRWCDWGMIGRKTGHAEQEYGNQWLDYFINDYDEEEHINRLLTNIIEFQKTCREKEVPNLIFCGWNIFVQKGDSKMWDLKKPYENKNDSLIFELYNSCSELVKKVDFSNFYLFENDKVKYGGLTEYSQHTLPKEQWFRKTTKPIDYHPSDSAHGAFTNEVILPWIKRNL